MNSCDWKVVAHDSEIRKLFTIDVDGTCKPCPKSDISADLGGPQVYRFLFLNGEGKMRAYIGETKDFRRRLREYQTRSDSTERTLRTQFGALGLNEQWRLEFLIASESDLNNVHFRRKLESQAVLEAKQSGIRTINSNRGSIVRGLNRKKVNLPSRQKYFEALEERTANATQE